MKIELPAVRQRLKERAFSSDDKRRWGPANPVGTWTHNRLANYRVELNRLQLGLQTKNTVGGNLTVNFITKAEYSLMIGSGASKIRNGYLIN